MVNDVLVLQTGVTFDSVVHDSLPSNELPDDISLRYSGRSLKFVFTTQLRFSVKVENV